MFYRKNLFAWEQVGRLIVGAGVVAAGLHFLPGWSGYLTAAGGLALAVTGVFGYCPACAMVGRGPVEKA